jgi:hypothetical protein
MLENSRRNHESLENNETSISEWIRTWVLGIAVKEWWRKFARDSGRLCRKTSAEWITLACLYVLRMHM